MLRITQQTSAAAARSYYSTADYFLGEGQELGGVWHGKGAERLGLAGAVTPQDWNALCENLDPNSGEPLTARRNAERRVGWDFTFSVPKSASVLYALTNDPRILDAFTASVDQTMADIESELHTRVRVKGQNTDRVTGNGVWGRFVHLTSRPVDGVPDPQLHAHCFLFNSTFDAQEDRWKAAQIGEIKRDANYFNAVMHGRLAAKLVELGVPIERTAKTWRVAGLDEATDIKFSRRSREIDAAAERMGITDPDAKAELGMLTRSRKNKGLGLEALRDLWRERLTADEGDTIARIHADMMQAPETGSALERSASAVACAAVAYAADHHFERESVVSERTLLATAMHQAIGNATPEQVLSAEYGGDLIVGTNQGRRMVTAKAVLEEERKMIAFARDGRGACAALAPDDTNSANPRFNDGQRKALTHLCTSRDRVMVLRGIAGAGKTTLLSEAVAKIEARGKEVFAFAPSAQASRDVLRKEGFENAETVAFLLANPEAQAAIQDQVILIDEAGLLGTRTMAKVFALADERNARVILSGDRYQHKSVERGSALRLLEEEAGIRSAQLTDIVRQKDQYRQAVAYLSQGRIDAGFQMLDDLKWVHEVDDPTKRYEKISAEYLQAVEAGKSVIVVSPTHAEGARVTAAIRGTLWREGKLDSAEHNVLKLTRKNLTTAQRRDEVNYTAGDVVVFTQNAKGYRNGSRLRVGVDAIPTEYADRFEVYQAGALPVAAGDLIRITANGRTADEHRVSNGQVYAVNSIDGDGVLTLQNGWRLGPGFGQIDYGYVSTSHASQGSTKDRVIIAAASESFPAASREQLYVSVSRGRSGCSIYTDDKDALLEAVSSTRDDTSATELTAWDRQLQRQRVAALASGPSFILEPALTPSEVTYER